MPNATTTEVPNFDPAAAMPRISDATAHIPVGLGAAIAACSAIGLVGLWPAFALLWWMWTTDPLRSIGMLLLPVSLLLILRAWRELRWELRGTWWGLLPLVGALACNLFITPKVEMMVRWKFIFSPLPVSLTPYAYVSGIVLLVGGVRLWKYAWFPLGLLLLLNPLPTSIIPLLDERLQQTAAHVTRLFATAIGFAPSTPQLLLMFTPKFGMFIAPGCDGVRGGVTLGYLVLIAGYVKRLPAKQWALYTSAAVVLGYVLNFVRLCVLVIYYRIAMGHPRMENAARNADYVIGGCLILLTSFLFFQAFLQTKGRKQELPLSNTKPSSRGVSTTYWKVAALAIVLAMPVAVNARAIARGGYNNRAQKTLEELLPPRIGEYTLVRTWHETMDGVAIMDDGAYVKSGVPGEITLAIWVGSIEHDTMDCLRLRDSKPEIAETPTFRDGTGQFVSTDSGLFTDGVVDTGLWNARCNTALCAQVHNYGEEKLLLRVFRSDAANPFAKGGRQIPILIRIDRPHTDQDPSAIYQEMAAQTSNFIASLDVFQLSARFQ